MDPITAASLIVTLLDALVPKIEEWAKSGDVTPEEQAARMAKVQDLQARLDDMTLFSGAEWQQSGRTQ